MVAPTVREVQFEIRRVSRVNWFEARLLTDQAHRLPANSDFHRELVLQRAWAQHQTMARRVLPNKYPGMEVYVYPESGKHFVSGQRYVDSTSGLEVVDVERLLSPSEFTGPRHKHTVLIVNGIKEADADRKVIVPSSIVPAHNVVRTVSPHVRGGRIVDDTGDCLPRAVSPAEFNRLPATEQAWFYTTRGQGATPYNRVAGPSHRRKIFANANPTYPGYETLLLVTNQVTVSD